MQDGAAPLPPPRTTMPLSTLASDGDTIVSWNIGLRGLRQLVDAHRGADKVAAKDEHGVSRQLGYGSIANLLASLGPSVRVVCLQETKLSTRADLDLQLACPEGWDSFFSVCRAPGKGGYAGTAVYYRLPMRVFAAEEGVTGALAPPAPATGHKDGEEDEGGRGQGSRHVRTVVGGGTGGGRECDALSPPWGGRGEGGGNAFAFSTGGIKHYGGMRERFTAQRMAELDAEGRALVVDFGSFVLFNLYVPAVSASSDDEMESRVAFKMDFLAAVETRYRALVAAGRRVVLCGDWNVAPALLDAAYAQDTLKNGVALKEKDFVESSPSRVWLARQLSARFPHGQMVRDVEDNNNRSGGGGGGVEEEGEGAEQGGVLVDVFRRRYPSQRGLYTCWNVSSGAQLTNYGTRIDYFLTDMQLALAVLRAGVAPSHQGSDHAPIFITIQPGLLFPVIGAGELVTSSSSSSAAAAAAPPLTSSVMLAGSGRQGSLDGFFLEAAAAAATMATGASSLSHPPGTITVGVKGGVHSHRGRGTVGVKRNRGGGTSRSGVGGGDVVSIKCFLNARGGGLAAGPVPTAAPSLATAPVLDHFDASPGPESQTSRGHSRSTVSFAAVAAGVPVASSSAPAAAVSADEAVMQWRRIQKQQEPPKCKVHNETCKVRKVTKVGPNRGRVFFCCPRPAGSSGDRFAACNFFQWAYSRK